MAVRITVNCVKINVYSQRYLALPAPLEGFFSGIKNIARLAERNASMSKYSDDLGASVTSFPIIRPKNIKIPAKK